MKCRKTYRIGSKVITVSWCAIGLGVFLMGLFIAAESVWGPF